MQQWSRALRKPTLLDIAMSVRSSLIRGPVANPTGARQDRDCALEMPLLMRGGIVCERLGIQGSDS